MSHHFCIGWVHVGGAWALCMLHLHVCPKLICCSCVCHGLEVHLRILPFILYLLWHELFSDPPFFMVCLPQGLSLSWLWAFLPFSTLFAPSFGLPVFLSCNSVVPATALFDPYSLCHFRAYCILFSQLVTMTQYGHWVYTHATLGFLDQLQCLWAPLAHFFLLGHPRPICFPWASSVRLLTLYSHELLLTLLGFPGPLPHPSSLGFMDLPSTSYFLTLLAVAYSYFSTSHNAYRFATSFFRLL